MNLREYGPRSDGNIWDLPKLRFGCARGNQATEGRGVYLRLPSDLFLLFLVSCLRARWSREVVFSLSSGSQPSPTERVLEQTFFLRGNKNEKLDALKGRVCVAPIQRAVGYSLNIRVSFFRLFSRLLCSSHSATSHHLLFSPARTHAVHAHLLVISHQSSEINHTLFLLRISHPNT